MQLFDPNNPNEKKKLIAAAVLGIVAIAVLGYVFFGGSSKKPATNRPAIAQASPTPARITKEPNTVDTPVDDLSIYQPVVLRETLPVVSEPDRNIFAYYEPPPPTPPPPKLIPSPTPTPTPPLAASSLQPSSVYARTPADFNLQVIGDRFTPAVHITIDGRDLTTRFINTQQVATTVPATLVVNPGTRQIVVRNNDGALYSNPIMLNVTPPPAPNYSYVGIIGKPRGNDIAVLQDQGSKELLNVRRGEPVGGRFRVVSISDREIVLIDTVLKIPHRIAFSSDSSVNPQQPRRSIIDDEP